MYQVKKYVLKIRDLPFEDQPREKLSKLGARALSSAELLAIILNTGSTKEGVMEMASRIIKDYGERAIVHERRIEEVVKDLDIPEIKAAQLLACAELGRRFFDKKSVGGIGMIHTARDVFEYVSEMRTLAKEHLRGIYLNSHHRAIHDEVITIGTVDSNLVHAREVFRPAIEYGAVAVVLAHNHPSGVINASKEDVEVTKQLIEVGRIIGIHLLDHVIIGRDSFKSINLE